MRFFLIASLLLISYSSVFSQVDDTVCQETRVCQVRSQMGLTGENVIIAILDRGIDYEHPDFRNDDGSTRILAIYDVTDNTGANASNNPYGVGTIYEQDEINQALTSGNRLATRDAVGHGTATAGLAGGNGRASSGEILGMAPNADFIIIKFTTEGAAAHDGEAAEDPFYETQHFPFAVDFAITRADNLGKALVALANFGSIQGPMDGTDILAQTVDSRFGSGQDGRIFITGTSDDGGKPNHASGTIFAGEDSDVTFFKGHEGNLRISLWYDAQDKFDVEIWTPNGNFGPYTSPADQTTRLQETTSEFVYYHNGSEVDFFQASSSTREILVDISGPVGNYNLKLIGASVTNGIFHASMNPSNIFSAPDNAFTNYVVQGQTIWDMASAVNNLAPNSYVIDPTWTDIDGVEQTDIGNDVGVGALWPGSGIGPTYDGRIGVTVSVPGNSNTTAFAPRSVFGAARHANVQGRGGMYGKLGFVSGAAPVLTGIVALMLEANPLLEADQVKTILQETARADAFTGDVPNFSWGYGKVDAFSAVAAVMGTTAIEKLEGDFGSFELGKAFPNPSNGQVNIEFTLEESGSVRLVVLDLMGRQVVREIDEFMQSGSYRVDLDLDQLPSGQYFYQLQQEGLSMTKSLTIF